MQIQPFTLVSSQLMVECSAKLALKFSPNKNYGLNGKHLMVGTNYVSTTDIDYLGNTGAPQGCVLSAFLFIVYTNALSLSSEKCKIIKFADDTVVIGLISDNNEKEYKSTIDYVSHWCSDNFLELNASKTKEIIFDMRKNKNSKEPVIINNTSVALVQSYKYLGVTIQENLKWNEHVEVQEKKANKRMYHVRRLKKQRIDSKIICLFYNSVVSSVLVYGLSGCLNPVPNNRKRKCLNSSIKHVKSRMKKCMHQ